MKKLLTIAVTFIVLSAATGGVASGQGMAADKWNKATVDPTTKVVNCTDAGWDCHTGWLAISNLDPELAKVSGQINSLLDQLRAQNKDQTRVPVFIATPHAAFLAWCYRPGKPDAKHPPISLDDNPNAFYKAIGMTQAMAKYAGTPSRWWYQTSDGVYWCDIGGTTQIAATLMNTSVVTASHDAVLEDYTNRINAILSQAAHLKPAPHVLSLLVIPQGLLLAWSQDDNTGKPPPKGYISATDNPAKIKQALGLQ